MAATSSSADLSVVSAPAPPVRKIRSPDEFKNVVRSYIELYDEIMTSQKQLHFLRKKKVELGDAIVAYMQENKLDELKLADGKLIRKTSKRVEALRKEHILETLKQVVGEQNAEKTLQLIFESRQVETKDALRRTRTKASSDAPAEP